MTPARVRLPNRRPSHVETLEVDGQVITACVGFDPVTDQPREVFLSGGKEGSQFDAMLADAATIRRYCPGLPGAGLMSEMLAR